MQAQWCWTIVLVYRQERWGIKRLEDLDVQSLNHSLSQSLAYLVCSGGLKGMTAREIGEVFCLRIHLLHPATMESEAIHLGENLLVFLWV